MIYLGCIVLIALAVWCLQDIIAKIVILASGVECAAKIEKFQEHRARSVSSSGEDRLQYRAVLKYTDLGGREHKTISPRLYERWESECLVGSEVPLRYNPRNPEKILMNKKELIRPIVILVIVFIIPVIFLLANFYVEYKYFKSFF